MVWSKNINGGNALDGVFVISGVLLVFSIYNQSYWLSFLGGLLLVLSRMSYYYLEHVADGLVLENEKETIRLSVGEETSLNLKLSQLKRLPILRATVQLTLEDIFEGEGLETTFDKTNVKFYIPIHMNGKETIEMSLPLKAKSRGATRIKSLKITVPNFFGFGKVELTYNPFIYKEFIIHPIQVSVPQAEQLVATKAQGDYPTHSSIYEQILAPIGTRDYVYTDSFQRIHWKASAKTQSLQTKVFERTAHYSWTFIINLREPNTPNYHLGIVENIEAIASNVAYLTQFATKKGIEFEVFLNLRLASGKAVYHLPIGDGTHQLGKILDTLSRIHKNGNTLQINQLLRYVEKQQQHSPVVIVCGPFGDDASQYFAQMRKKGQKVYILQDDLEYPAVVPFGRS